MRFLWILIVVITILMMKFGRIFYSRLEILLRIYLFLIKGDKGLFLIINYKIV